MELRNIDAKTFDDYVKHSPKPHFLQSAGWADVAKSRGYIPHLLGLYDNDEIIGSALLLERKILCYATFYCPRGFILDYKDHDHLKAMTILLKDYVKRHKGLYFKIDPDLVIHKLNSDDASIKMTDEDNLELIDTLKDLGYRHRGFTVKFNESSAPRFTFRVDIDKPKEAIREAMHQTTRQILNKNNPYHIKIRKNNFEDFKAFYATMVDTAHRKSILLEPLNFYETFYDNLHKRDMSDLFAACIDVNELKALYQKEIEEVKEKIEEVKNRNSKKTANRLLDLENHLRKLYDKQEEIAAIREKEIVLSAIITAKYADKVWLMHGGNRDILQFLNANYYLYNAIIMDSHENGYKVVDFYGSEGKVDKSSELYGLYLFKSRFGGDFDEFIGEFDYIVRPFMNKLITFALNTRRKIKLKRAIKKGAY